MDETGSGAGILRSTASAQDRLKEDLGFDFQFLNFKKKNKMRLFTWSVVVIPAAARWRKAFIRKVESFSNCVGFHEKLGMCCKLESELLVALN